MKSSKINVKQPDPPIAPEIMAESIARIGEFMKQVDFTRLRHDTIVVLLADATGISKRQCAYVFNALLTLEETYLKPKRTHQ